MTGTRERRNGEHLVKCFAEEYEDLLAKKVQTLKQLLASTECITDSAEEPEVFRSPPTHHRMRANFNVWRDKPKDDSPDNIYYAMFDKEKDKNIACEIKSFPRGTVLMNKLMDKLMTAVKESLPLRMGLFEARFVTTKSNNAVIVLIYKRPLNGEWQKAADKLASDLNVKVVGRSRKMKLVAGGDEIVEEVLTVRDKAIKYYHTEGAFSQPNATVCEKMLEWALKMTDNSNNEDLLELYCGGGTFTAALAQNFRKVFATEISKSSVELAHKTFKANSIENIRVVRLSSEEFSDAYDGVKAFQRLNDAGIKFSDYSFSTVLVDPPRAGLDEHTCRLLCKFDKIVYISCNPETLARDMKVMSGTHEAVKSAAFDQFPYTHHLECGVLLVKKKTSETAEAAVTAGAETAMATAIEAEVVTDEQKVNNKKRKAEEEAEKEGENK
jgi:tRNA (uracil-5-)-methyltransferase